MLLAAVGATAEGLVRRIAPPEAVLMFGGLAAFLARHVLPVAITMMFLFILYRIAAPAGYTTRHAAGGALLATLLWEGAKTGFALYLRDLAHYAGLYGALEGVIVLAIWIELSVSIVLYGAEVVALTGPNGEGSASALAPSPVIRRPGHRNGTRREAPSLSLTPGPVPSTSSNYLNYNVLLPDRSEFRFFFVFLLRRGEYLAKLLDLAWHPSRVVWPAREIEPWCCYRSWAQSF